MASTGTINRRAIILAELINGEEDEISHTDIPQAENARKFYVQLTSLTNGLVIYLKPKNRSVMGYKVSTPRGVFFTGGINPQEPYRLEVRPEGCFSKRILCTCVPLGHDHLEMPEEAFDIEIMAPAVQPVRSQQGLRVSR